MENTIPVVGDSRASCVPRPRPTSHRPTLTDEGVQSIVETTARRVVRLLQRRGLLEQDATDPLWEDEPLLAELTAASSRGALPRGSAGVNG